jgi:cell division protein FtsB
MLEHEAGRRDVLERSVEDLRARLSALQARIEVLEQRIQR